MSDIKLKLEKRELVGKKIKRLRAKGLIPSVIYGGDSEPILTQSEYVPTDKAVRTASYHSSIDLDIDGKPQLAMIKNVAIDPVRRTILSIDFQAISADEVVTAFAPIQLINFEASPAAVAKLGTVMAIEELEVKAKPADLPKSIDVDGSKLEDIDSKIEVKDIVLPKGVELADKELSPEQVVVSLFDPAAEAAQREAEALETQAELGTESAADVPAENGGEKAEEPQSAEPK